MEVHSGECRLCPTKSPHGRLNAGRRKLRDFLIERTRLARSTLRVIVHHPITDAHRCNDVCGVRSCLLATWTTHVRAT